MKYDIKIVRREIICAHKTVNTFHQLTSPSSQYPFPKDCLAVKLNSFDDATQKQMQIMNIMKFEGRIVSCEQSLEDS